MAKSKSVSSEPVMPSSPISASKSAKAHKSPAASPRASAPHETVAAAAAQMANNSKRVVAAAPAARAVAAAASQMARSSGVQVSPSLKHPLSAFDNFMASNVAPLVDYLSTSLPPGPKFLPMRWIINLQKAGTFFYVLFLMYYFNNWSITAYIYLALHGSYGYCWLLKDQVFPDSAWERKATVLSWLGVCFGGVLGLYWIAGYITVSQNVVASPERICVAVMLHTFGVVAMMGADSQKFFVLKAKKGLISDGWFALSRNPNYLGEMMLYSAYAVLAQHWAPWVVYAYVWSGLFYSNMARKELSLRQKSGFEECDSKSGMLLPSPAQVWNALQAPRA